MAGGVFLTREAVDLAQARRMYDPMAIALNGPASPSFPVQRVLFFQDRRTTDRPMGFPTRPSDALGISKRFRVNTLQVVTCGEVVEHQVISEVK